MIVTSNPLQKGDCLNGFETCSGIRQNSLRRELQEFWRIPLRQVCAKTGSRVELFSFGSAPSIFEGDDPVENRLPFFAVFRVDDEVPFSLELESLARFCADQ